MSVSTVLCTAIFLVCAVFTHAYDPNKEVVHQRYVRELNELREAGESLDVVFYGDSITESWRGTDVGTPVPRTVGIPELWESLVVPKYNARTFGVAGDVSRELLYRLQNGEAPYGIPVKAIIVLIGTNDIAHEFTAEDRDAAVEEYKSNIEQIVDVLQDAAPNAMILLIGILPRGPRWTYGDELFHQPSIYSPYFSRMNSYQVNFVTTRDHLIRVSCGSLFLKTDGDIDNDLMPDGTHPNVPGMTRLFRCYDEQLQHYVHGHGETQHPETANDVVVSTAADNDADESNDSSPVVNEPEDIEVDDTPASAPVAAWRLKQKNKKQMT